MARWDWRHSSLTLAAALAVLGIGVWRIAATCCATGEPDAPVALVCRGCGAHWRSTVKTWPPYACRECGERRVVFAAQCGRCAEMIAFTLPYVPRHPPRREMLATLRAEAARAAICPKCSARDAVRVQPPDKGER